MEYRLRMGVGLLQRIQKQVNNGREAEVEARKIAAWGIPRAAALALITGQTAYNVEHDDNQSMAGPTIIVFTHGE
jgi:hypothetical protein